MAKRCSSEGWGLGFDLSSTCGSLWLCGLVADVGARLASGPSLGTRAEFLGQFLQASPHLFAMTPLPGVAEGYRTD